MDTHHETATGGASPQEAKRAMMPAYQHQRPRIDNNDYLLPMSAMVYLDVIDDNAGQSLLSRINEIIIVSFRLFCAAYKGRRSFQESSGNSSVIDHIFVDGCLSDGVSKYEVMMNLSIFLIVFLLFVVLIWTVLLSGETIMFTLIPRIIKEIKLVLEDGIKVTWQVTIA